MKRGLIDNPLAIMLVDETMDLEVIDKVHCQSKKEEDNLAQLLGAL
jgi:hypothetical protein